MKTFKIIISSLCIIIYSTTVVNAQTVIKDKQEIYGNWSKANSPYIINGEAIVPSSKVLIIEAGTIIKLKTGKVKSYQIYDSQLKKNIMNTNFDVGFIRVNGKIVAKGTSGERIIFTKSDNNEYSGLIVVNGTEKSEFINCDFEYLGRIASLTYNSNSPVNPRGVRIAPFNSGLFIINSSTEIKNCKFIECPNGIESVNSNVMVEKSSFENNETAISISNSTVEINSNRFFKNSYAIICYGLKPKIIENYIFNNKTGISINSSNPYITNNTVIKNERGFVFYNSSPIITNSIIWYNKESFTFDERDANQSNPSIKYSFIQDVSLNSQVINLGNNSFNIDPQLNDDFSLKNTSKCIASGENSKDIGAFPRTISTKDVKPPLIRILSPQVKRGFQPIEENKQILVTGIVTDESGIYEVTVNGEEAEINIQGEFSKRVLLALGDNKITINATDTKNNTSSEEFTVTRNSKKNTTEPIVTDDLNVNGKYYALIIGIQDYMDSSIKKLEEPLKDVQNIHNVLITNYTFEKENIVLLKNPQRTEIIETLDNLTQKLTQNDNLLIFYAGHGYWDENLKQGFWLPVNAKQNSRAEWISNSTIRDYISGIKAKHTLLIADACFSGGIFKTRKAFDNANKAVNELLRLPSRKGMTSGTLTEVPDKSVFVEFLLKRLSQNTEDFISSEELFYSFKQAVINNSPINQVPQFGEIRETGDEGGDFIFIKRKMR
jgi:parallel beta-helix repeat protein